MHKAPFGTDIEQSEELWATQLSEFEPEEIERAVLDWTKELTDDFPTLGEFVTVCDMARRHLRREAAIARGAANVRPDMPCPECGPLDRPDPEHPNTGDENHPGWVVTEDDGSGARTVRPCSACRPEQHAAWKRGWRKERVKS
jgi:hypothetical protein